VPVRSARGGGAGLLGGPGAEGECLLYREEVLREAPRVHRAPDLRARGGRPVQRFLEMCLRFSDGRMTLKCAAPRRGRAGAGRATSS
jgi:hypothetical protein